MLSYNILNDFVEKLKSGNVKPEDLVKVSNAVKDADLQVKYEVENIKAIPSDILNEVKCGDVIAKKTGEQYHCYIVTYKQENHGICLTYFDASVVETQSYDYVTNAWVYNSEDKTNILNYSAGDNVSITNGVISATDTKYTAGEGIDITGSVISSTVSGVEVWESVVLVPFNSDITIKVHIYTAEQITALNINSIMSSEIGLGKELPCYLESISSSLTGLYIPLRYYFDGAYRIKYIDGDGRVQLLTAASMPNYSIVYSHKIN